MSRQETPATLTVEQAAKRLRIGRNQAYESVSRGEIPHLRMGKRILVLKEPLERMLRGETPQRAREPA